MAHGQVFLVGIIKKIRRRKGVFALNKGNIYVVIVSVKHKSAIKLAQKLIKKGFNPARIVVVTNIMNVEPLLALGILPKNIGKKNRAGFAGGLNLGSEMAVRNDTFASVICLSTEIAEKRLMEVFATAIECEGDITKKKMFAIGSKGEDGMLVCRAETIMSTFLVNDIKNGGTTLEELYTILEKSGITIEFKEV